MELSQDDDNFVNETQYEQLDGDLEYDNEESGSLKIKRETQNEGNKRSGCWQYFDIIYKTESDGTKKKHGECKHCKKHIKADPKKNGTSGLIKHLKTCEVNPEVKASKEKQANLVFNKDTSGEGGSSVNVWKHDEPAINQALLDFFVCAEVPFKLVEHWAFVRLVNRLNGKVKLPSRHKLSKDIAKYYIEEKSKLFVYLSDPKTTIHLTNDTWTSSCQKVNYMVVTAHFIDENWVMHKRIINFRPIESHKGDDIGFELLRCINGWGIQNVMTITLDNATSNDKAMEYLVKKLPNLYDKGKHFHVRCMAHILNLLVKDGLGSQKSHVDCVHKAILRHCFDKLNDYFYFAVILDPTMKSGFLRHCFRTVIMNQKVSFHSKSEIEKMVGVLVEDVEDRLGKLFETYQARFETVGSGSQEARNEEDAIKSQGKNDFFTNYLHVEENTSSAMETELIRYLQEPKVTFKPGFDILKWWSVNGNRFPIVAQMARDILAIQISSVASESAFSTGGRVLDPYRTRLSTNIVEALICTQDWVKKSNKSIFMDQVDDILNDDDIAMEIEEAVNNQKGKGKEEMLVQE